MNDTSNVTGNEPKGAPRSASKKKSSKKASSSKAAAAKIAAKMKAEVAAKASAAKTPEATGRVYYMACRHWHVGAFFTEEPSLVKPEHWFSALKEPDQAWPSDVIPCQVCGEALPFKHHKDPSIGLIPYPRFVKSMTKAAYDALVEESEAEEEVASA